MLSRPKLHLTLFVMLVLTSVLATATPSAGATAEGRPVRLLSSTGAGVTFEVDVPWEQLALQPLTLDGKEYVRVLLPGWSTISQTGAPALPLLVQEIGAPFGVNVTVQVVPGKAHTVALSAPPLPVARQEVEWDLQAGSDSAAALPMPTHTVEEDATIYADDALYPAVLAGVTNDGVLRQQRVVGIAVCPVQYHPGAQALTVYRSLRVEVIFEGATAAFLEAPRSESAAYETVLQQGLLNYASARQWRRNIATSARGTVPNLTPNPSPKAELIAPGEGSADADAASVPWTPPEPGWRVKVREDGIYRLTYSELQAAGLAVDELDPRNFHLYNLGHEVAIYVVGEEDSSFDFVDEQNQDYLVFYGQAVDSKYARDNVYWLTYGQETGLRVGSRAGTPGEASTPGYYTARLPMEGNAFYLSGLPGGDDVERWLWGQIVATGGNPKTWPSPPYTFTLAEPYSQAGTLTVALWGNVEYEVNPDHHVRILVNGTQVGADVWWDGRSWQMAEREVPAGLLVAGSNTIEIVCPNDTGVGTDIVYVDWMELEFANTFLAVDDVLAFGYEAVGTWKFEVGGFSSDQLAVYDVTDPAAPVRITGIVADESGATYTAVFEDAVAAPTDYWALADYRTVQAIEADTASNLQSTDNGADHIIIYHSAFVSQAEQLRLHRASQWRAIKVDAQDVYDEFGYGIVGVGAIHDFLAYAYSSWADPAPSFVVLLGDGSLDPKDYLDQGRVDHVPANLVVADPWIGETAADNRYVTLVGGDTFPDVMLGRLAVNSSAQATAFVNKIIAYEESPEPGDWQQQVLAVADDDDPAGNFPALSDGVLNTTLRDPYLVEKVYYLETHFTAAEARAAVLAGINAGKWIVNYIGHGAPTQWGGTNEALFTAGDVAGLSNGGMTPVMLVMTCRDGYYHSPTPKLGQEATAEVVTRAEGKGAVASWSPTGLGVATGHDYLDKGFLNALFDDPDYAVTLGAATIAGKLSLWGSGSNQDLIDTYLLFGDPATVMPIAAPPGILGDVNDDGLVDSTDALIVLSADAGFNTSQFCPMNCGDANADGYVDSTDALIILSYDALIPVPFPVGEPGCPSNVTQPLGCGS